MWHDDPDESVPPVLDYRAIASRGWWIMVPRSEELFVGEGGRRVDDVVTFFTRDPRDPDLERACAFLPISDIARDLAAEADTLRRRRRIKLDAWPIWL